MPYEYSKHQWQLPTSRKNNIHLRLGSTSLNRREVLARYLRRPKISRISFVTCTTGVLVAYCVVCRLSSQGVVAECCSLEIDPISAYSSV